MDRAALHDSAVAVLHVSGMGCGNCADQVRNSLLGLPGVLAARVDLAESLVRVNFTSERTELHQLLDAVAQAGHDGHHEYRAALVEATW
ncbi:MAG: heavy-metal-associated domain-containing protein [Gemmatimonadetes bacterium]|nr:heavy-metal-associated domain-containing protein [Gemmatimonadota bacterium]MBI2401749.1 heavy-metal-associated domain-containing protein [Gemmatimonadota bacterium]MBI2616143.1 heavy-metal-associated domain-containing protein [Gemmatimonadota bacterium]